MYLSSKSTTLTAARCPTRTRRRVMSVGEAMSHTAMDLSLEHVTISPLLNLRCSTASLWWISVFRTSPVFTSQTLRERAPSSPGKLSALQGVNVHQPAPDPKGEPWLPQPWQGRGRQEDGAQVPPLQQNCRQAVPHPLNNSHNYNVSEGSTRNPN